MKEELLKNRKHLIAYLVAGILTLASWGVSLYFWNKLPELIPTHFGFTGAADAWAKKSIISVFFVPLLQTIMLGGFLFLYWKPQYSDMPTTLWLMTMDEKVKEHAFGLIRTMLVVISVWIGLIFTYLTYGINASAVGNSNGLNPWFMGLSLAALIVWLIFWTIKVYRATRFAIKKKA